MIDRKFRIYFELQIVTGVNDRNGLSQSVRKLFRSKVDVTINSNGNSSGTIKLTLLASDVPVITTPNLMVILPLN